jgi:hypothetical protein
MSQSLKGKPSSMLGRKHSEETKKKMSIAAKGRKYSREQCLKMSETAKRYYAEHEHPHKFTEEDYKKSKILSMKRIRIVETGQEFESMTECANYLNANISNISNAVKYNRKCAGYHYEIIPSKKPDGQSKDVASSEAKQRAPVLQGEDMT